LRTSNLKHTLTSRQTYLKKAISSGHWCHSLSALEAYRPPKGSRSPPRSPRSQILAALPAYQTLLKVAGQLINSQMFFKHRPVAKIS